MNSYKILNRFDNIKVNKGLAFSNIPRSQNQYLTHGYHRYPAKFIPSLASYLILRNTKKGELICDPFGGCGTSLVESKVNGRRSIGIDINPVAELITKTKITPLIPKRLALDIEQLLEDIQITKKKIKINKNYERLSYWFPEENLKKLSTIYASIIMVKNKELQRFYLCAFSQILKNSSRWLMKSIKPQVDQYKKISDPFLSFERHLRYMERKNEEFYSTLLKNKNLNISSKFYLRDARKTSIPSDSIDYIITSPPYVTSYEYADLHQLSLLWLRQMNDWGEFRSKFIGTSYFNRKKNKFMLSDIGNKIVDKLTTSDQQLAKSVRTYFEDMGDFIKESKRILKPNKKISLVLGNTTLKGVDILNAEVAFDQMEQLGFKNVKVEKRQTSSQSITPFRDKLSGRFTSVKNPNKRKAYQFEYIITGIK